MSIQMQPLHKMTVQCDWNEAIGSRDRHFWLTIRPETDHVKVETSLVGPGNQLRCTDPQVEVHLLKEKLLFVKKKQSGMQCYFQACDQILANVHKRSVISVDVNGAGSLGVSSSIDGDLVLWALESGQKQRNFAGHLADVYKCRFFPAGSVVLSAGADMLLKIWNTENGECCKTFAGHVAAVTDLAFIDIGRNLLTSSKDGTCKMWQCSSGSCVATFGSPQTSPANVLGMMGNGHFVVGHDDGNVRRYTTCSKDELSYCQLSAAVTSICSSFSDNHFLCGLQNGRIVKLDARNAASPVSELDADRGAVLSIRSHGTGYFCSFSDGSVTFFERDAKNCSLQLTGADLDAVNDLAIHGNHLFACCRDSKIRRYQTDLLNDL